MGVSAADGIGLERPVPTLDRQAISLDRQAHGVRPDLLTIQQSPPSAWPRGMLFAILVLVALLMAWAVYAKLDIIASAQGRLVPMTFTKVVHPAESGVVLEIRVKDGDVVKAGQVLMRLDERLAKSEMSGLTRDVAIKRLTLRRIDAELSGGLFVAPTSAPRDVAAQVQTQFKARRQSYQDAIGQETEALKKAKAELASAEQVLSKLRQTLPSYKQSAEAYEKLLKEGYVGDLAANEKKREFVERDQDLRAHESTVESLRAVIAGSERKLASIKSSYTTQLENERIETITLLNKSAQELDKSTIKSGLLDITAPTDGVVKDLAVTTRGAVVQAGALLMNIVPREEPVQAEVLLSNEDVGFVSVGQKAFVKIAAFPFQKYGLLEGKVTHLSADSADPKQQQQASQVQLTYRALVSLDAQKLISPAGDKLNLSPGMLVSAEIHQGRRTVLEYLLSPVLKVRAEAARER
jgi:hemolysin D